MTNYTIARLLILLVEVLFFPKLLEDYEVAHARMASKFSKMGELGGGGG
jgi:hypothetical protein